MAKKCAPICMQNVHVFYAVSRRHFLCIYCCNGTELQQLSWAVQNYMIHILFGFYMFLSLCSVVLLWDKRFIAAFLRVMVS